MVVAYEPSQKGRRGVYTMSAHLVDDKANLYSLFTIRPNQLCLVFRAE